jgi:hypothetical protein
MESVMGGEITTRGTRGTHSECAEANAEIKRLWCLEELHVLLLLLPMQGRSNNSASLFG